MPKLSADQWEKKAQFWSEQAAKSKTFQHLMWCVELAQRCIHEANLATISETEPKHTTTHEMSIKEEEQNAIHLINKCIHQG